MKTFLIQAMGVIGAAIFNLSFQTKSNRALYIWQGVSNLIFCVQFFLLGSVSGALSMLLLVTRNSILSKYHEWAWVRWKGWIAVISLCSLAMTIASWQGWISLLPLVAVVGSTFGYWTDNAQKIRLYNLVFASTSWLAHNILVFSLGGIINEVVGITSTFISIARFGWKNMGENKFGETDEQKLSGGNE